MLSVPRRWSDVTPGWMTEALQQEWPGVSVADAKVLDAVDGTNRRARVKLSYSAGTGPASVFVKREGRMLHRLALVALGALTAEARLAQSGARLPIEHPSSYAAAIDLARMAAVVVMEDVVAGGCRPNEATTPLPVEEVRHGLEGLASLHAAFWDRPLPAGLQFLRPWRLGRKWAPVSAASLARGIRRLEASAGRGAMPRGLDALGLERQFRRSATLAAAGPQTVLHGDPHPGNTYSLPGSRTGFYDWQLVRLGNWSHDVGYFLAGSLSVQDRRASERDLLSGYLEDLERAGVRAPGFARAWELYRATPAFGLGTWMHTISAGTFQADDVCVATIERFAAAYSDLGTAESAAAR